jgi:hypothetical protein
MYADGMVDPCSEHFEGLWFPQPGKEKTLRMPELQEAWRIPCLLIGGGQKIRPLREDRCEIHGDFPHLGKVYTSHSDTAVMVSRSPTRCP